MAERTCVICGVGIDSKPKQWRTCSPECSAALRQSDNRTRLAGYRNGLRAKRQSVSDRSCLCCGKGINDRHPNAQTCSEKCIRSLTNERVREAKRRHAGCVVCGAGLRGSHGHTKTCSAECKREYQKQYAGKYYAQFGRKQQASEARKTYMREYSQRNKTALDEKKAAYREANRERLRKYEADRRATDGDRIRQGQRDRYLEHRAALQLYREITTKGLEALL